MNVSCQGLHISSTDISFRYKDICHSSPKPRVTGLTPTPSAKLKSESYSLKGVGSREGGPDGGGGVGTTCTGLLTYLRQVRV